MMNECKSLLTYDVRLDEMTREIKMLESFHLITQVFVTLNSNCDD